MKYVYKHIDFDGKVFYIGCGSRNRTSSILGRNKGWNEAAKNGFIISIIDILPKEKALSLEKKLISYYGLDNLTNIRAGGANMKSENNTKFKTVMIKIEYDLYNKIVISAKSDLRSTTQQINTLINEALNNRI